MKFPLQNNCRSEVCVREKVEVETAPNHRVEVCAVRCDLRDRRGEQRRAQVQRLGELHHVQATPSNSMSATQQTLQPVGEWMDAE